MNGNPEVGNTAPNVVQIPLASVQVIPLGAMAAKNVLNFGEEERQVGEAAARQPHRETQQRFRMQVETVAVTLGAYRQMLVDRQAMYKLCAEKQSFILLRQVLLS